MIPRVTFGMIVLNGEPFIGYNLSALYPFAHQIIVVEGAAPGAANIATSDGHSLDSTLETVRDFIQHNDPEKKITLVTAEDEGHRNGFWPGEKDEQSQAYAKRATGELLWQVDVDEFYQPADMARVLEMMRDHPEISAVTFKIVTFWGGLDYWVDGWYLRRGASIYNRLFRWKPGYRYKTHRPPTVVDEQGRTLHCGTVVTGEQLEQKGICLYHYSLLFPHQVEEKCNYYAHAEWAKRNLAIVWANTAFKSLSRPYRVHNVYDYPSWLNRFRGLHPPAVRSMMDDIRTGQVPVELRRTDDIERLLDYPYYRLGRLALQLLNWPDYWFRTYCARCISKGKRVSPKLYLRIRTAVRAVLAKQEPLI